MLERRKVREETVNSNNDESKSRNFGMIPGTTLHSSYVDKSYDQDSRLVFYTWLHDTFQVSILYLELQNFFLFFKLYKQSYYLQLEDLK